MESPMDDPLMSETIGARLRRLREERGLTQRALASGGVSHAHISRIESGAREPSVKALRVLARRLGVSPDYLELGVDASGREQLEQRLADAELGLRLGTDESVRATLLGVLGEAERAGDSTLLARAQAIAGLAAAREGDQREAIGLLEAATAHPAVDSSADPDLFVTLGTCYLAVGREADAIALYERCLSSAVERVQASRAARVRFATHLSNALADGGRIDEAAGLLDEVAAEPDTDAYSRVRVEWSLARLHVMQGRSERALASMATAIALLEETEDELQRARAELMCAEILAWDGQDERAAEHVARCDALRHGVDADDLGALYAVEALIAVRQGDRERAEAFVLQALQILGGSAFGRPLACLALLHIHLAAGALGDARHAYEEGLVALELAQMWPQATRFCRDWAQAQEELGQSAEAAAARTRALAFERRTVTPARV
jgi:transcriptional regulator with XRE-family HTH domain